MEYTKGLTEDEVLSLQQQYGKNVFAHKQASQFLQLLFSVLKEPMFLMLVVACTSYFILGQNSDGLMLLAAILFVTAISLYQEGRSTKALKALQDLTAPKVLVFRNGIEVFISSEELVPGDIMLLDEGGKVPADALILKANDLTINESIITGESLPVDKGANAVIYQGSTINSGSCYAKVTAIGNGTELGKIGKAITGFEGQKTLLQHQINKLVRRLALFGFGGFALIFIVSFLQSHEVISSILLGLTLAMAAVPEEIPVAFSSFMALGAYHMTKLGIITRQPQTIENLGAVSVICMDKTGTITENNMQVKNVYSFAEDKFFELGKEISPVGLHVLYIAVLASEQKPFDAMEKAIVAAHENIIGAVQQNVMVQEYPLEGKPPMMTHVYQNGDLAMVAGKGGAEHILAVCKVDKETEKKIMGIIKSEAAKGFRVIAVASAKNNVNNLPLKQDYFDWHLEGFVSLYDPPKRNISGVLQQFYNAGIKVNLLTGDYAETALTISNEVGLKHDNTFITGDEVMQLSKKELGGKIENVNIFVRMFPEAKTKVIEVLKEADEVVAMMGDGVNDGPAIKLAHIGIAMGKQGTEIARQAADLVLTDDNMEQIAEAIRQGRKIFSNLKKAVRYIISIHIPIILTASLPLVLGWRYPTIFTPIHVIFLELIMGPTCSVFYEKEPVTADIMNQPPRNRKAGLFSRKELWISILLGLTITGGVLSLYYWYMQHGAGLEKTRTIVFTTLITANLFLTFSNRSLTENFIKTLRYKNSLAPVVLIVSIIFLSAVLTLSILRSLFGLVPITLSEFFISLGTGFLTVCWFEGYKTILKKGTK